MRVPVAGLLGVAALAGGACGPSLRIGPPLDLDLASHASRLAGSDEISTGPAIVRLRLPPGWIGESRYSRSDDGIEPSFDVDGQPMFADLPRAELLFHDPQRTYAGGVYYITPRERLDVGEFRRHELRDGFARNIDDALLSPARLDGRDAFIVRGRFDQWNSALTNQGAHRTRPRGDVALAAVHLPNIVTLVVVLLVSEPGRLSRDPGPALEIFGSLRFRDMSRRPMYEEEPDDLGAGVTGP